MAKTTNTWAWTSPGVLLRAMMAVVTETAMIDPDCLNIPRRPAIEIGRAHV